MKGAGMLFMSLRGVNFQILVSLRVLCSDAGGGGVTVMGA